MLMPYGQRVQGVAEAQRRCPFCKSTMVPNRMASGALRCSVCDNTGVVRENAPSTVVVVAANPAPAPPPPVVLAEQPAASAWAPQVPVQATTFAESAPSWEQVPEAPAQWQPAPPAWTPPASSSQGSGFARLSGGQKTAVVCSGLMAIGALGPWIEILGFSVSGTKGDGWFIAGLAAAAGLTLLFANKASTRKGVAATCFAVGLVIVLVEFGQLQSKIGNTSLQLSDFLSWGLPLALISGIIGFIGSLQSPRYKGQ